MSTLSPDQWRVLSPHLDEALEMGPEERAEFFSSLRAQNPTLVRELEVLLAEHRALSDEGFLENCSVQRPGEPGMSGQTIGAYTLVSQIGHGGRPPPPPGCPAASRTLASSPRSGTPS